LIISNKYKFSFIHIPKCAGSHIKNALQQFNDGENYTKRIGALNNIENVDFAHLPLKFLKNNIPHEYEKLCEFETYAIVRDPEERFYSAFSQYVKKKHRVGVKDLDIIQLKIYLNDVICWLKDNGELEIYPSEFIYFMPQCKFIFCDNQQIVKGLYFIDDLDVFVKDLESYLGTEIRLDDKGVGSNKTVEYRSPIVKLIFNRRVRIMLRKVKKLIPRSSLLFLMNIIYKPSKGDWSLVLKNEEITKTITDIYKQDYTLLSGL
jgi:hypothetical protein